MGHIINFGLSNFRSFAGHYKFDFSPITILTGTNSSGKSSLIKAFLLLKAPFEEIGANYHGPITTMNIDPSLNLGNFDTILNSNSESNNLIFDLPCHFDNSARKLTLRLVYKRNDVALKNLQILKILIFENEADPICTYNHEKLVLNINFTAIVDIYEKQESDHTNYSDKFHLKPQLQQLLFLPSYSDEYDYKKIHNKTLLNYLFLHEDAWIEENISAIFPGIKSKKELAAIKARVQKCKVELQKLTQNTNITPSQYVLSQELKIINEIIFQYDLSNSHEDHRAFPKILGKFMESLCKTEFTKEEKDALLKKLKTQDKLDSFLQKNPSKEIFFLRKLRNSDSALSRLIRDKEMIIPQKFGYSNLSNNERSNLELLADFCRQKLGNLFTSLHSDFKYETFYLPAVRAKVERTFNTGSHESLLHELITKFHSTNFVKPVIKWMNDSFNKLGIADKVELKLAEDGHFSRIIIHKNGRECQLTDVGYGFSQILPIILKIALIANNHEWIEEVIKGEDHAFLIIPYFPVLIIEEPETNLHPALQSKLAEIFVDCFVKFHIQIIIETHSEYLIRKLQYLTAKGEIIPEFTQLYYFYPPDKVPEGEKQVKKINILEDGSLSDNFGAGFFDETTNLIESIWLERNK